jgi:hypothetical protein
VGNSPVSDGQSRVAADGSISIEVREQLLAMVVDRLQAGHILVSPTHFKQAMEEGYASLTGSSPGDSAKRELEEIVRQTNTSDPEVLQVPGIENWVTRSVLASARKLGWGSVEVQEDGHQAVRDFVRSKKVQAVLQQLDIKPSRLNLSRCLRSIAYAVYVERAKDGTWKAV